MDLESRVTKAEDQQKELRSMVEDLQERVARLERMVGIQGSAPACQACDGSGLSTSKMIQANGEPRRVHMLGTTCYLCSGKGTTF